MLDRKEHWFCLEPAGHTRVIIHILLLRIDSTVAQWELGPSESTQPTNPFIVQMKWRLLRALWEQTMPRHCSQCAQLAAGRCRTCPYLEGNFILAITYLSQRAGCGGSHLKSIIEMKGSSSGTGKWWMKSLSFKLDWNSISLEGTFVQLIYSKKRNQF